MGKTFSISLVVKMQVLEGILLNQLAEITKLRSPFEAVGLILSNGDVLELTNLADEPSSQFKVSRDEILLLIQQEPDASVTIFWHSHPNGGIGPSRIDMRQKTPFTYHLVITLVDGEIIPTWY